MKSTISKIIMVFFMLGMTVGLAIVSFASTENMTAQQVVEDMKAGWNLGNTFDSYDFKRVSTDYLNQFRDKYQIQASYSTLVYSGWDAGGYQYFDENTGKCTCTWTMRSLNSSINAQSGHIAIQLINNPLRTSGNNEINYSVTEAIFTKADGSKIQLNGLLGEYSSTISNGVTQTIRVSLIGIDKLSTTADLIGGTLVVKAQINTYPKSARTDISSAAVNYYETLWGNPTTTKEMIDCVKEQGFNAVRIPVTWYDHLDEDGDISDNWLDRIEQVVNYVIDNEMYAIINVHHDAGNVGWIFADTDTLKQSTEDLTGLWSQIAARFKNHNHKLLFQGTNEIVNMENDYNWITSYYDVLALNTLNQEFVNTVRNTGSKNESRFLIISTYGGVADEQRLSLLTIPRDSAQDKIIVSVNDYSTSTSDITALMERLNTNLITKNIPVIIGEFGTSASLSESIRVSSARKYVTSANTLGITCFWWDDGSAYKILDRETRTWKYPGLVTVITDQGN